MKALLLYTTSGCHLCEEAVSVLNSLDFEWFPVEISTHDSLIERYGLRIPVIRVKGMTEGPELDWPFTQESLKNWLRQVQAGSGRFRQVNEGQGGG